MAVSVSETEGWFAVVVMRSEPVCAVLLGWAVTLTVMLWPWASVTGRATVEPEKVALEKVSFSMVTDFWPVEVMVSGCDETLPLEPLKLSADLETLTLPL